MSLKIDDLMWWPDQQSGDQSPKRDSNLYDQDMVLIWNGFDRVLWSLSLQAPIDNFSLWGSELSISPPSGKQFFNVLLADSIKLLIKNNHAGPNGECLTLKEILKLYRVEDENP